MKRTSFIRALLAGSAFVISSTALAQQASPPADAEPAGPRPTRPPTRRSQSAKDLDDAQAKIELLQAQVEALQESIAQIQAATGQGHAVVEGRAAAGGQGRWLQLQAERPRAI